MEEWGHTRFTGGGYDDPFTDLGALIFDRLRLIASWFILGAQNRHAGACYTMTRLFFPLTIVSLGAPLLLMPHASTARDSSTTLLIFDEGSAVLGEQFRDVLDRSPEKKSYRRQFRICVRLQTLWRQRKT